MNYSEGPADLPGGSGERSPGSKSQDLRRDLAEAISARLPGKIDPTEIEKALGEAVSEEYLEEAVSHTVISGPIPAPSIMQGYNNVLPGSAERLLSSFESEQAHRQREEHRQIGYEAGYAFFGLFSGWSVAIGALVLSGIMATLGHTEVAIAALGVSVFGVVGKIVEQRFSQPKPSRNEEREGPPEPSRQIESRGARRSRKRSR